MFLSNAKLVQLQPLVWQRSEGILRQALLSPDKEVKAEDKMLPVMVDISESDLTKKRTPDLTEAIQLYPTGTDGSEYGAHLLSELTSTTLPTISSSQVSSVLSALEPPHLLGEKDRISRGLTDNGDGCPTEAASHKDDKEKSGSIGSQAKVIMEKQECHKRTWYKCVPCGFICLDENRANSHVDRCPGVVSKVRCIACSNTFKSTAVLKVHLLIDHSVSVSEHPDFITLNLGHDSKESTQKSDKEHVLSDMNGPLQAESLERTSLPPTPGFSLFESVEKYIVDVSSENNSRSQMNNDILPELKKEKKVQRLLKKSVKKLSDVKLEKEIGSRCGVEGCSVRLVTQANMDYHRTCHQGVKLKCAECGIESQSWAKLSVHLWKHHGIDIELYSCDQCSYKTNSLSKLMNLHRRTHGEERPFLCDLCGKGFKTTKQLRNHKTVHRAKDKSEGESSCNICGRVFTCNRMLRHHTDIVHRKLRPYLCSDCGHSAASRSSLRMHSRQHTGEKPYRCTECDYRTSDHNTLRRHKMWHTGAKQYNCPHCPYASIQSSTFKSHLKKKHPGLDEGLMFSCEVCPFKTVKKENFLAHTSYHSLKTNELSKETDVDLPDYNLRNLVKEVSESILPCSGQSFLSNGVVTELKAEQILSRQQDPLLGSNRQPEDMIGENEP